VSDTPPENSTPEGETKRSWPAIFESVVSFFEKYSAVLAGLGLLVYVLVRAAYDAFYGRLGVTAEEAGVTYLLIVARAALGIVIYLSIVLVAVSFLAWLLQPQRSSPKDETQDSSASKRPPPKDEARDSSASKVPFWRSKTEGPRSTYTFGRVVIAVIGLLLIVVYLFGNVQLEEAGDFLQKTRSPDNTFLVRQLAKAAYVLAAIYALQNLVRFTPAHGLSSAARQRTVGFVTTGFAFSAVAFSALTLFGFVKLSEEWGVYKAELVKDSRAVSPSVLYGILNIRAVQVCVVKASDGMPFLSIDRPLMYLGQSNGMIVVYDGQEGRARRIPSGDFEVSNWKDGACASASVGTTTSSSSTSSSSTSSSSTSSTTTTSRSSTTTSRSSRTTSSTVRRRDSVPSRTKTKSSGGDDSRGRLPWTGEHEVLLAALGMSLIVIGLSAVVLGDKK
jgi:hypothetical protein